MKYAFLHHQEQKTSGKQKAHHLIYLGKGSFSSLRNEKFTDEDALKKAFMHYTIPETSKKGKINLAHYADEIRSMVTNMNITYISYADFKQFCLDNLEIVKQNRQIYKLLRGMIQELEERKLA